MVCELVKRVIHCQFLPRFLYRDSYENYKYKIMEEQVMILKETFTLSNGITSGQ